MTPEQQLENFAKGWIASHVRYEPVEELHGRLKIGAVSYTHLTLPTIYSV